MFVEGRYPNVEYLNRCSLSTVLGEIMHWCTSATLLNPLADANIADKGYREAV